MQNNNSKFNFFLILWLLPIVVVSLILITVLYYHYGFQVSLENLEAEKEYLIVGENQEVVAESPRVTLLAVGDIMLSRNVGSKMFKFNDYTLPFSNTWELLMIADITFGNLESPFYNQGPRSTQGMVFKAEPQAVEGLNLAGFDVLSLANNHTLNQGIKGLDYTLEYLAENDIQSIGAGRDFSEAHQPAIIIAEDTTFGFLAYSYADYNDSAGQQYVVAGLDIEQAKKDIKGVRDEVDILIVSMHAGTEYVTQPNWQQEGFARAVIEAGADLVIGHHPHWPQIIEQYQDKWIFYSLGNFVFDQEWSQETKEGLILQAVWQDRELQELKLIPIIVEDYSTPRLANSVESEKIMKQIGLNSEVVFQK